MCIYSYIFKLQSALKYSPFDEIHLLRPFFPLLKTVLNSLILMPFSDSVTEQRQGVVHDKLLQKGFPLSVSGGSFPHAHLPGSKCPPPEERCLSMSESGEKERNCLFKSYTNLRVMT